MLFLLTTFLLVHAEKPNILLIQLDQLTSEVLSFYGQEKPAFTPNLDKLASRGTVFRNFYTNNPLCAPSRCSMVTGRLASKSACWDNAADFLSTIPTISHYLRDLGYETILSGKMHFVGPDQLHGYDERLTTDVYPADPGWYNVWDSEDFRTTWHHDMMSIINAGARNRTLQMDFDEETLYQAKRKLFDIARQKTKNPFFLTVSFTQPHDPYLALPEYFNLYQDSDIPEPLQSGISEERFSDRIRNSIGYDEWDITSAMTKNARRAYYGMVSHLDDMIGEILTTLDRSGLAQNTWILVTADHGDQLGERDLWYKMTFYDWSIKIPFLLVDPMQTFGKTVYQDASLLDLAPTLIDIAGGEIPKSLEGVSLLKEISHRDIFAEYFAEGSVGPRFMIKTGDFKFVFSEEDGHELYNVTEDAQNVRNLFELQDYFLFSKIFLKKVKRQWNVDKIRQDVLDSQQRRALIYRAMMKGKFPEWDFIPNLGSKEVKRYTRNTEALLSQDRDARIPQFPRILQKRKPKFEIHPIGGEKKKAVHVVSPTIDKSEL